VTVATRVTDKSKRLTRLSMNKFSRTLDVDQSNKVVIGTSQLQAENYFIHWSYRSLNAANNSLTKIKLSWHQTSNSWNWTPTPTSGWGFCAGSNVASNREVFIVCIDFVLEGNT